MFVNKCSSPATAHNKFTLQQTQISLHNKVPRAMFVVKTLFETFRENHSPILQLVFTI